MRFVSLCSSQAYAFGGECSFGGTTATERYYCTGLHALGSDGHLYAYSYDYGEGVPNAKRCWVRIDVELRPAL